MKISLDIRKSLEENAASYFEKAKKEKKKLEGAKRIVEEYRKRLSSLEEEKAQKKAVIKPLARKEWYEKFRWFISSDSFLVIGGRDATTNEVIIKKYVDKDDLVFHTEAPGSPFVVVKKEGKAGDMPGLTREEAAAFTAAFSKAWKQGLSTLPVFQVKPEQVSKQAKSGEYLTKGAFMIYGEKEFYNPVMSYGIGLYHEKIMGGPLSAVKKHCKEVVEIIQGDEKLSDVAKQVQKRIGGELDEIMRVLPPGCKIKN
ncbi:MAG TPA: NFACT RNA binding domain-containing protein [Candidatus Nanoarchaeia archaeon]|nr:NFACT RNA binding domain-containing protein [Candidatus Nanoarchaeia archaeon]